MNMHMTCTHAHAMHMHMCMHMCMCMCMCIHMCMYPALPPLALSLRNQKYIFRSTKDSALVVNAQGASIDLTVWHR